MKRLIFKDFNFKYALKGGDIKFGIHLHKLMFEAIVRTKIIYLEKSRLFSIDENTFQNFIHLQKDISEENFQNVCESLQTLPKVTSGVSCYLELYLDMVTLLLNTIFAQRTGNWKDFFSVLGNSSHTVFH